MYLLQKKMFDLDFLCGQISDQNMANITSAFKLTVQTNGKLPAHNDTLVGNLKTS